MLQPLPHPGPADRGAELAGPDGAALLVRPIAPADADRLATFFLSALDAESRRLRFLGPKPRLTAAELRHLAGADQAIQAALVAVDPRTGEIVAESRAAPWVHRPGVADLAFAVREDLRGRGIGGALAAQTVALARVSGTTALTASTLWENRPARALLRRLGFRAVGSAAYVLELELALRR